MHRTLFLPAMATATSVVALIDNTNHRVVIAADCRVNRQLASLSRCKIIDKPGCTAAMAGLYEEKTTGFHLRRLAEAACQYPGDLRAKAEAFLQAFKNSIRTSDSPYSRCRSKRLWPNDREQGNRSDFRGHPKWTDCVDRQRPGGQFSWENKCGAVREHCSVLRAGRIFSGPQWPHSRSRQVSSRLGEG